MKKTFLVIILFGSLIHAQSWDTTKIAVLFGKYTGAMIVYDLNKEAYYRFNSERCRTRFLPASTFKIPNTLIGLETGVLKDENYVIKWDGIKRSVEEWNRDHALESALKYSVVPYYQELARRVGRDQYLKYLHEMDYGNETVGDRVDTFWLDNSLKISCEEQIIFLKNFVEEKLPFSKRTFEIMKKIISEEKYDDSLLKFKTGTGNMENGKFLGWLVGYILKRNDIFLFSFNVEGNTFNEVAKLRNELSRKILVDCKFLE